MIYLHGRVYACGKPPLETAGLTDMELYRHTLKKYTQALPPTSVATLEAVKTSTPRIRILRIILLGGGALPGRVQLY
jgi:hypothetical protein